jgi:type III secretory pathway component EscT
MYIPEIWVGFVLGVLAAIVFLLLMSALSSNKPRKP